MYYLTMYSVCSTCRMFVLLRCRASLALLLYFLTKPLALFNLLGSGEERGLGWFSVSFGFVREDRRASFCLIGNQCHDLSVYADVGFARELGGRSVVFHMIVHNVGQRHSSLNRTEPPPPPPRFFLLGTDRRTGENCSGACVARRRRRPPCKPRPQQRGQRQRPRGARHGSVGGSGERKRWHRPAALRTRP